MLGVVRNPRVAFLAAAVVAFVWLNQGPSSRRYAALVTQANENPEGQSGGGLTRRQAAGLGVSGRITPSAATPSPPAHDREHAAATDPTLRHSRAHRRRPDPVPPAGPMHCKAFRPRLASQTNQDRLQSFRQPLRLRATYAASPQPQVAASRPSAARSPATSSLSAGGAAPSSSAGPTGGSLNQGGSPKPQSFGHRRPSAPPGPRADDRESRRLRAPCAGPAPPERAGDTTRPAPRSAAANPSPADRRPTPATPRGDQPRPTHRS